MTRRSTIMAVLGGLATFVIILVFGSAAGFTWMLGFFLGGFVRGGWRL